MPARALAKQDVVVVEGTGFAVRSKEPKFRSMDLKHDTVVLLVLAYQ